MKKGHSHGSLPVHNTNVILLEKWISFGDVLEDGDGDGVVLAGVGGMLF